MRAVAIILALSTTLETILAVPSVGKSLHSYNHAPLEPRGVHPIKQVITNHNDDPSSQSYTLRVKVGTPPQDLTLALELSQSDTCRSSTLRMNERITHLFRVYNWLPQRRPDMQGLVLQNQAIKDTQSCARHRQS
jgi:hypothetical protein